MNIGFYACIIMTIIFGAMTILFTILGEKAAMLISGFNTMPNSQRDLYDKKKLSKDQRNSLLLWTIIMAIGASLAYFISQYIAIIAFIVWLILFFKDVHLDADKAFEKYKIK
ncbi:MAG TPA: DUF3784 domain-containing protein [Peptococcaceae bacterium]|nr:DUF3784 domain-containing protein [Peptococcaceae bacterium]